MLKYSSHELQKGSITDENSIQKKIDEHDSGTESDGVIDVEDKFSKFDIACSSEHKSLPSYSNCSSSSVSRYFLDVVTSANCLMYDHHSSEEELEVINGSNIDDRVDELSESLFEIEPFKSPSTSSSCTINESRKRSIAQSSDDEARGYSEEISAPVANFCTSPPIEALKPHRGSIVYRPTSPLVLADFERELEGIKISEVSNEPTMDTQSVSPPSKLFHYSVSPKRRQIKSIQRLERPHRPSLDFDKMQQVTKIL